VGRHDAVVAGADVEEQVGVQQVGEQRQRADDTVE
jgi:hypothetical protein